MNKQVCILKLIFTYKFHFKNTKKPVYSYSTITTIYLEVGIHAELLANRD